MSKIHVIRANTDPVGAPERAGIHWINQTTGQTWFSSALAGVPFWKQSDLDSHIIDSDPHPQYETAAEVQAKVDAHANLTNNPHGVTKAQVGLGNVDNTNDADKPISTAQQVALDLKINLSEKGAPLGVATLDAGSKIPASQLPSYVDDVLEYADFASFPVAGETGKIYTALDTGKIYRWSGSVYVEISASPGSTDAVPEGVTNLYFTTARVLATVLAGLNTALTGNITDSDTILQAFGRIQNQITANLASLNAHIANVSNPHATTAAQVGAPPTSRTIATNDGLQGGGDLSADRTLSLTDTAVTPATYGSETQIPQFTVDQKGRITGASNLTPILGRHMTYAESLGVSTIASATPTQKLRLTTPNVEAGTYRIGWNYKWYLTDNGNNFEGRVQLDDATDIMNHAAEPKDAGTDQRIGEAGFAHIALSAGVHTFDIDYNRSGGFGTAGIAEARLEFWRIS